MRASRWILLIIVLVVLLAGGGGLWWYMSVPHTAEAQFAYAEKLEKELRGDAVTKTGKELQEKTEITIEQYRRVGTRFGKSAKAAEGVKRIAKIREEISKDSAKALATLDELGKDYPPPDEENAGFALIDEARLIRIQADALKAEKKPEAEGKYKEALAKLEEYRKTFEKGKRADDALMEIGRIWQDGLEEPPIHAIDAFEKELKDYPASDNEAEALFRLAREMEKIKNSEQALELYAQLVEKYPKSKWAADATYARGKLLAEREDKHDEAAKEFERMAQEFPDDPRAGQAAGEAKSEKDKAAAQEGEKYGKSRYGGTVPFDTTADKALPPADMFAKFTAQKLDAEKYDLKVAFLPDEHRITVNGTLKLTNRGEDKNRLLLMLGAGLKISSFTVDGVEAKNNHSAETLQVLLPTELKKDASTTLAFTYTGQYADPKTMANLKAGPGGGTKGAQRGSSTQPATAPSAAPATGPAAAGEAPPTTGPAAEAESPYFFDPQMCLGDYGYALSGASWYPITIIGDVFDAHVTITTPANLEAVSNGALVKREKATNPAKQGTFEFQTKNPVFGLYFAYGPYVVQEKQVGDIHFYTYLRAENASKHEAYVDVTNGILSFYASKFAGFPYEKMAIIDTPLPPFLGGVGPASLMFLQGTMVDHKEVPENLLAHELAHQWFGNLIPINITDAGYNQWLSEGFATYCDALYTQHKDGDKAFLVHMEQYQQLFFQFAMRAPKGTGAIRDIFSPMSPLYRPVIYEKGAIVLHMLRKVMGDEKFFLLMKTYVERFRNKTTTVDDFRRLASEIHGQDLSWFFAQWIDQTVFAHWKVAATVTADSPGGGAAGAGGGATIKVIITQPDDLVKMPADVTLIGAKDERQVVKDVLLDKKENVVEAKTPFVPVKVIVDEDHWVLRRPGSDNIWSAEKAAAAQ